MPLFFRIKNFLVKLWYRLSGRSRWKTAGLYPVVGGKVFLDPADGLSAWKRRWHVWEPVFFHRLDRYIAPNEQILEFGSCFGDTGLRLLANAPDGKFLGVEPFPRYFAMLQKTLAANSSYGPRLRFVNVAYSRDRDSMDFVGKANPYADLEKLNSFNYGKLTSPEESAQTAIRVPALTLRGIIEKYDFHPTLIFMDIEGAEMGVLEEMLELGIKPKLAWEHHAHTYGQAKLEEMLNRLRQVGYTITPLDADHFFCQVAPS